MGRRLETLANAATIVLVLCGVFVMAQRLVQSGRKPGLPPVPGTYAVGDNLSQDVPAALSGAARTLVVAIQQECRFCEASMPLYSRIIEERTKRHANLGIVFLAPDRDTAVEQYLASKQVIPDRIVRLSRGMKLNINATPTLLLIDKGGRVLDSKTGLLQVEGEQELWRELFGA